MQHRFHVGPLRECGLRLNMAEKFHRSLAPKKDSSRNGCGLWVCSAPTNQDSQALERQRQRCSATACKSLQSCQRATRSNADEAAAFGAGLRFSVRHRQNWSILAYRDLIRPDVCPSGWPSLARARAPVAAGTRVFFGFERSSRVSKTHPFASVTSAPLARQEFTEARGRGACADQGKWNFPAVRGLQTPHCQDPKMPTT